MPFCTNTKDVMMEPKTLPFAVYSPANAKGGCEVVPAKTALVCIEFQNEFTTEGGKLHDAVKGVMKTTNMLEKAPALAEKVRAVGGKVMHVPIMFKEDSTDNPNKKLGILAGCNDGKLFTESTWNSEFCKEMTPKEGDVTVVGKKGLDAFPNTTLEAELKAAGIETIALCGFLTNCCVESTMRTACEKGFNVVTVTDCCAATSEEGHAAAAAGTFGMFSAPMTADDFAAQLKSAVEETPAQVDAVKHAEKAAEGEKAAETAAPAAAEPEAAAPAAA